MNILHIFWESSLTVKLVMLLLLAASCLSWGIILWKSIHISNERKKLKHITEQIGTKSLIEAESTLGGGELNTLIKSFLVSSRSISRNDRKLSVSELKEMGEIIDSKNRLSVYKYSKGITKGIGTLATIGSVAPYIGLFGTVWGLLVSFQGLAQVKVVTIQTVAPGIVEALIATAIGLLTAIPAYIFYNHLSKKSSEITKDVTFISQQITSTLMYRTMNKNGG